MIIMDNSCSFPYNKLVFKSELKQKPLPWPQSHSFISFITCYPLEAVNNRGLSGPYFYVYRIQLPAKNKGWAKPWGFSGHLLQVLPKKLWFPILKPLQASLLFCHLLLQTSLFVVVPNKFLLISAAFRISGKHPCLPKNGKRAKCGGENAKCWVGFKDNEEHE